MPDELERSVELLERLLGDPHLRRRFRTDAATVLTEAGLPELAAGLGHGGRALMTLEMRESRSSLAGVMVAAAAEGVDLAQFAEHAAPALARDADAAVHHLMAHPHHSAPAPVPHAAPPQPAKPSFAPPAETPTLAPPEPKAAPTPAGGSAPDSGSAVPTAPTAPAQPEAASAAHPAAMRTPSQGARLVTGTEAAGRHHAAPAPEAPDPPDTGPAYPGDQATPQQLAAWMGARAEKAGLPPELPVMAALTESGLRNLSYGDRDSVGFFQMRVGIWDQGAYAGYPSNPELQLQWFIDHAAAVKGQYPELANNPNSWGEWVADVEQPAEQYRYRYQLQLSTAQALLRGADLTSGAPAPAAAPVPPPVPVGQEALKVAMHFTGGGPSGASLDTGPTSAELVQYAYGRQGVQVPRVAAQQFDVGMPVSEQHLEPGDAVFFAEPGGYVDHVGLYVGNGRFVTAADGGGGVKLASIAQPPFQGHYVGARRYTAEALSDPGHYARPLPTIKG
ncbi:MAG TPA: C40 family peptidase [Solirubrobacteraceae bacterium]|nr:C40 family peptidase [Solirubrobacteraceae bacterium]